MEVSRVDVQSSVQEIDTRVGFLGLEREWNTLVESSGRDGLFHRHEFIRIWLDNFAPSAHWRILILRDGGELRAALPLIQGRARVAGVPVRQLSSAANSHSCRFDLIAMEPEAAAQRFLTHLRTDSSWDVLCLTDVPDPGAGGSLLARAESLGLATGSRPSLQSPFVPLPAKVEEFRAGLSSKFQANCRRRRRKLEEQGPLRCERYTGGPDLDARLQEGFLLEQSGWKGEKGTSIVQDPATRGFYVELAREAAAHGRLALYFLRVRERAVAFHYGLTHGRRYLLLKPGYDERFAECSPGQLLMQEVVDDCIRRGESELDFLGPDMEWKRVWTGEVRPHRWLYVFNDSVFARGVHAARFRWLPKAKALVSRWRH